MQRSICFLWILVIFLCPLIAWAQSVEQLYQDGQHKEQILGDLQAAISSYQKALGRANTTQTILRLPHASCSMYGDSLSKEANHRS